MSHIFIKIKNVCYRDDEVVLLNATYAEAHTSSLGPPGVKDLISVELVTC